METKEIKVMESIYSENDKVAAQTNENMTNQGVFVINIMGAPGTGKTSALKNLIPLLDCPCYVIEGDIESDLDTKTLLDLGIKAVQINTGGACHLDSPFIADAANSFELEPGIMFIENIGNLVCPAEFLIGEHIKILIANVTEGSDKPYKYPLAFEKADMVLLNKCDLLPYIEFDETFFMDGVRKLNPSVPVFKVSGKTGTGFSEVAHWILEKAALVIKR